MFKILRRASFQTTKNSLIFRSSSSARLPSNDKTVSRLSSNNSFTTSKQLNLSTAATQTNQLTETLLPVIPLEYELDNERRLLQVSWSSGETSLHPWTWLRDNCRCDQCFHKNMVTRKILMGQFSTDPEINKVELNVKHSNADLLVEWSDGHTSQWTREFLLARSFTPDRQTRRTAYYNAETQLWGKELTEQGLPSHDYEEMMQQPSALLAWLEDIEKFGLVMVNGMPTNHDSLYKLIDKVAYPEISHYGGFFEVSSNDNPRNLAFTSITLGMHTDLPYYKSAPGIQLMHFFSQSDDVIGGENDLTDGFYCAMKLKEINPKAYNILTNTLLDFCDYGSDETSNFHMLHRKYTIEFNPQGQLSAINFNNQMRDSYLNIPADEVQPLYDALKLFNEILYDSAVQIKGKTGQMMVFDNQRVLHGRQGFQCTNGAVRRFHGVYLRWDEARSRIRRLRSEIRAHKRFEEDIP